MGDPPLAGALSSRAAPPPRQAQGRGMSGPPTAVPPLPQPDIEAIAQARHGDPFRVLGPRDTAVGRIIRAFLPGAQTVEVLRRNDHTAIGKLAATTPDGFFEGTVVDRAP